MKIRSEFLVLLHTYLRTDGLSKLNRHVSGLRTRPKQNTNKLGQMMSHQGHIILNIVS
jgi:hypothetical protein